MLTYDNQVLDSRTLEKRIKVCREERTKACLHYLIFSFFCRKPVDEFCAFRTLHSRPFTIGVPAPAKEFDISSQRVVLSNNLQFFNSVHKNYNVSTGEHAKLLLRNRMEVKYNTLNCRTNSVRYQTLLVFAYDSFLKLNKIPGDII